MDGFSIAAVTATCVTLSHRALSATLELDDIIGRDVLGDTVSQRFKSLSTGLGRFKQAVEQLREKLGTSPAISDELQHVLSDSLVNCDNAAAIISKQVKRVGPETPAEVVDLAAVVVYEDVLESYARLSDLQTHLLSMRQRADQTAELDQSASRAILAKAVASAQELKQLNDPSAGGHGIIKDASTADEESTSLPALMGSKLAASTGEAVGVVASSQAAGSSVEASSSNSNSKGSGGGGFMSSLQSGFKAITAAMRPKPEPFVSALCQAASRGDLPQMKGFLGEGANINGRNEDGNPAIICATLANQVEAVRFLLDSGADHKAKDSGRRGKPAFFHAVDVGSGPLIELYLARGVDINEKNIYGQPYLVEVVNSGNVESLRLLLKLGANPSTADMHGNPIVALATKKGDLPMIKLLFEFSANVNSRDCMTGQPIIAVALSQGRDDIVKFLLSRGADPNSKTAAGNPIIIEAVKKNDVALVKTLLERGATATSQDVMGTKLLSLVIKSDGINEADKEVTAKLLLNHGANANEIDVWGKPSLFTSVIASDNRRLIKMFLEHGANPNAKPTSEQTFLLNAMDKGDWDLVTMLLQHGASPNDVDKQGRTPLLMALQTGKSDIVKLLIQRGVDVNKPGSITPIVFARATGDTQTEQLLRLHGAQGTVDNIEPLLSRPVGAERTRTRTPPPHYDES